MSNSQEGASSPHRGTLLLLFGGACAFYLWLIYFSLHPALPTQEHPLLFYSNQTRQDLKLTFSKALKQASRSLHLSMYAVTDPEMLYLLHQKAASGLKTTLFYDPTASVPGLKRFLPPTADVHPVQSRGLMHRKIVILDDALVFLGSANWTTQSLKLHDNFTVGLYHPPLASFLQQGPFQDPFFFEAAGMQAELWLLPETGPKALEHILAHISAAKHTIHIAMFTFTHPQISQALIQAKQRGVDVCIALDYFTGRGASKKSIAALQEGGIPVVLSGGQQLLHHKWALIDEETLIIGSANWTKAAFERNEDFLLLLFPLPEAQKAYMRTLWQTLLCEGMIHKS